MASGDPSGKYIPNTADSSFGGGFTYQHPSGFFVGFDATRGYNRISHLANEDASSLRNRGRAVHRDARLKLSNLAWKGNI